MKDQEVILHTTVKDVKDGSIAIQVGKFGAWATIQRDGQVLRVGLNAILPSAPEIDIPISGEVQAASLTVEQMAEVIKETFRALLPTCEFFIGVVVDDFGYVPKQKDEGGW